MYDVTYMPQKIGQLGKLKDQNIITATVLTMNEALVDHGILVFLINF